MTVSPLQTDLDGILAQTPGLWDELRGARLFVTGGTGFFGRWLLESFVAANDALGLEASALVLSRSPDAFLRKAPDLAAHRALRFHAGDVRDFEYPPGEFRYVIHAATDSVFRPGVGRAALLETIVAGTRRVLDFAVRARTEKLLFVSSGAVYGTQPAEVRTSRRPGRAGPIRWIPNRRTREGKRVAELSALSLLKMATWSPRSPDALPSSGRTCLWTPTSPSATSSATASHGGPLDVRGDGTPRGRICTPPTWRSGCGPSCSAAVVRRVQRRVGGRSRALGVGRLVADRFSPRREVLVAGRAAAGATRQAPVRAADHQSSGQTWACGRSPVRRPRSTRPSVLPGAAPSDDDGSGQMKDIKIGSAFVGDGHPCFVIAEIGINHNGDIGIAKKLIDVAEASPAATPSSSRSARSTWCTRPRSWPSRAKRPFGTTNGDLKRGLEFGQEEYRRSTTTAGSKRSPWFASCWDEASVDFIDQFDPPCYKIASASLTDDALLRHTRVEGQADRSSPPA